MSIPVNLYVDRMSPVEPVRVADIYAVTQDRAPAYKEAAAKIGLTTSEYIQFRQALTDGNAIYVRLPRHIDAMAGVHRRNGHVYALRNVVVPSGTMGWQVALADGTTVIIPQICGNLSLNHGRPVAARKPRVVAVRKQPRAVRGVTYTAPKPAEVAAVPVSFDVPAAPLPVAVPIAAAAHSGLPFLGLLFPAVGSAFGGHSSSAPLSPITPTAPTVPSCSGGSNEFGACRE